MRSHVWKVEAVGEGGLYGEVLCIITVTWNSHEETDSTENITFPQVRWRAVNIGNIKFYGKLPKWIEELVGKRKTLFLHFPAIFNCQLEIRKYCLLMDDHYASLEATTHTIQNDDCDLPHSSTTVSVTARAEMYNENDMRRLCDWIITWNVWQVKIGGMMGLGFN